MTPDAACNIYTADMLAQPEALRRVDMADVAQRVEPIVRSIGQYRRILLTGMGASHAALRPLWLSLLKAGRSAWLEETSDVLAAFLPLLERDTLVIAASQSGRSAELVALADELGQRGAPLLAITNDGDSPLARAALAVAEIHAGAENAVSTKTYVNTLATTFAIRRALSGQAPDATPQRAADALDAYLETWTDRVEIMKAALGLPERLFFLGRGESLAAARYGALIMKEAAKWPVEAQSAAQFRHGPLELADGRLSVVMLAGGAPRERELNLALETDLTSYGARVFRLDADPPQPVLAMPAVAADARPIAEVLPLQILTLAITGQTGIEPGCSVTSRR